MAEMFLNSEHICQALSWVKFISQAVPDRDASVFGKFFDGLMGETTEFNTVKHAAKH